MITDKLKPCPFCGKRPGTVKHRQRGFIVQCVNPDCPVLSNVAGENRAEATKLWNTRTHSPTESVDRDAVLREALEQIAELGDGRELNWGDALDAAKTAMEALKATPTRDAVARPSVSADVVEAVHRIAAYRTGGPHKPGQIKSEHRAMIEIARAALASKDQTNGK